MSLDFFISAKNGNLESVQNYINQEPGNIDIENAEYKTALIIAALNGKENIVEFLISKGANLDIDNCGYSALMAAYSYGYQNKDELTLEEKASYNNIVIKLIEAGANLYKEDVIFGTLLMQECSQLNPNPNLVDKLIEKGGSDLINRKNSYDDTTALMNACSAGNTDIVTKLINGGADINLKENRGENALMYACREGKSGIVEILLNKDKTEINEKNFTGFTAYMIAHQNNKPIVEDILKEHGANDSLIPSLLENSEYDGRKKSKSVKRKKSKSSVNKRKKSKSSVNKRKKSKSVNKRKSKSYFV